MTEPNQNMQMIRAESHELVPEMGVMALNERIEQIKNVMKDVMIEGFHYGKAYGGSDKANANALPVIYKPGYEILLCCFGVAMRPRIEKVVLPDGHSQYTVYAEGIHIATGRSLGVGIASASTAETKYAWKWAGDVEYADTPEHKRRKKYYVDGGRTKVTLQVATNPADQENTVLKMADKRATAMFVLKAFGASSCFAPEPEEGDKERMNSEEQEGQPASARASVRPANVSPSKPGAPAPEITTLVAATWDGEKEPFKYADVPGFLLSFTDTPADGQSRVHRIFLSETGAKRVASYAAGTMFTVNVVPADVPNVFIINSWGVIVPPAPAPAEKKDDVIDVKAEEVKG